MVGLVVSACLQAECFEATPNCHIGNADMLGNSSYIVLSGGPKRLHFLGHRIVFGERIRHRLEHGPQLLSIFPLSLEESCPGFVRVVPIEELVSLVGNTVAKCNARYNCPSLFTAEPIRQLVAECTKRQGPNRCLALVLVNPCQKSAPLVCESRLGVTRLIPV